jgi:hypothetical protein
VDFDVKGSPTRPVLGVVIKTDLGTALFGVNNRFIPGFEFERVQAPARISCHLDRMPLTPGTYLVDLYFGNESRDIDTVHDAIEIDVLQADVFGSGKLPPSGAGPILWPATFYLQESSAGELKSQKPVSI